MDAPYGFYSERIVGGVDKVCTVLYCTVLYMCRSVNKTNKNGHVSLAQAHSFIQFSLVANIQYVHNIMDHVQKQINAKEKYIMTRTHIDTRIFLPAFSRCPMQFAAQTKTKLRFRIFNVNMTF